MDWSQVTALTIPEGNVKQVSANGVVLWKKGLLPSGYTQLEYIESTGTQYIDTSIKGSNTLRIEMTAQATKVPLNYGVYFGCGSGNSRIQTIYFGGTNQVRIGDKFNANLGADTEKFDVVVDVLNKSVTYNGTTAAFAYTTTLSNLNIYLFTRNEGSSYADKGCAKLWSFKIYDNNILVRNFIPAMRNSDGEVGMYDTVTGQFSTNVGTGEFIAGDIV